MGFSTQDENVCRVFTILIRRFQALSLSFSWSSPIEFPPEQWMEWTTSVSRWKRWLASLPCLPTEKTAAVMSKCGWSRPSIAMAPQQGPGHSLSGETAGSATVLPAAHQTGKNSTLHFQLPSLSRLTMEKSYRRWESTGTLSPLPASRLW